MYTVRTKATAISKAHEGIAQKDPLPIWIYTSKKTQRKWQWARASLTWVWHVRAQTLSVREGGGKGVGVSS